MELPKNIKIAELSYWGQVEVPGPDAELISRRKLTVTDAETKEELFQSISIENKGNPDDREKQVILVDIHGEEQMKISYTLLNLDDHDTGVRKEPFFTYALYLGNGMPTAAGKVYQSSNKFCFCFSGYLKNTITDINGTELANLDIGHAGRFTIKTASGKLGEGWVGDIAADISYSSPGPHPYKLFILAAIIGMLDARRAEREWRVRHPPPALVQRR